MLTLILWIILLIFSLLLLVKGADWLVENSEKVALVLKISPFIIGVTIVAMGTSLPELTTGIFATLKGRMDINIADVVGSNIANILLIVGLASIVGRCLIIKRSLIDLDSPFLLTSTLIFIITAIDGKVNRGEALILIFSFLVYLAYTIFERKEEKLSQPLEEKIFEVIPAPGKEKVKLNWRIFGLIILGIVFLLTGAKYTIESIIKISQILGFSASILAITVVAVGTSLPELVVSIRAAAQKHYEISVGNIFGSNIFNILFIVGLPAMISPQIIDKTTFQIGLPFLVSATILLTFSSISQKIHLWEGSMYLIIYLLFIIKLIGLF